MSQALLHDRHVIYTEHHNISESFIVNEIIKFPPYQNKSPAYLVILEDIGCLKHFENFHQLGPLGLVGHRVNSGQRYSRFFIKLNGAKDSKSRRPILPSQGLFVFLRRDEQIGWISRDY